MSALPRTMFDHLRSGSLASRSVVVCLLVTLPGCGAGTVSIEEHPLSSADAAICADVIAAVPDTLAGLPRRPTSPDDAPGAAWGDPAYVLTCGVPKPDDYARDAPCSDFGGIGWFIPDDQISNLRVDADLTALTHSPFVGLRVPSRYRTRGVDLALTELAPILSAHLRAGEPCL